MANRPFPWLARDPRKSQFFSQARRGKYPTISQQGYLFLPSHLIDILLGEDRMPNLAPDDARPHKYSPSRNINSKAGNVWVGYDPDTAAIYIKAPTLEELNERIAKCLEEGKAGDMLYSLIIYPQTLYADNKRPSGRLVVKATIKAAGKEREFLQSPASEKVGLDLEFGTIPEERTVIVYLDRIAKGE